MVIDKDYNRNFEYLNNLINTKFEYFIEDLTYTSKYNNSYNTNAVISKHYDYVEFIHHDLIKNTCDDMDKLDKNINLVKTFTKRKNRFIEYISNENNNIIFLCHLPYVVDKKYMFDDMLKFNNNKNIKCNFMVVIFYSANKNCKLELPTYYDKLNKFVFIVYKYDNEPDTIWRKSKLFYNELKNHVFKSNVFKNLFINKKKLIISNNFFVSKIHK